MTNTSNGERSATSSESSKTQSTKSIAERHVDEAYRGVGIIDWQLTMYDDHNTRERRLRDIEQIIENFKKLGAHIYAARHAILTSSEARIPE